MLKSLRLVDSIEHGIRCGYRAVFGETQLTPVFVADASEYRGGFGGGKDTIYDGDDRLN